MRSGARVHNDNFHTLVSSFKGQHFGKKIGLLPTAGAENHAFGGFTPHPPMPTKFEKMRPTQKAPGTYCKVMSSAQEHLSVICAKFLQLQVAQNKGVKIVRKALSGAIAWHSVEGKFYAMPHNETLVGG